MRLITDELQAATRTARRRFIAELVQLAHRTMELPTPERRRMLEAEIAIARDALADIETAAKNNAREYLLRAAGQPTPEPLAPVSVYESRGFHVFKDGPRDGWVDL